MGCRITSSKRLETSVSTFEFISNLAIQGQAGITVSVLHIYLTCEQLHRYSKFGIWWGHFICLYFKHEAVCYYLTAVLVKQIAFKIYECAG